MITPAANSSTPQDAAATGRQVPFAMDGAVPDATGVDAGTKAGQRFAA